MPCPPAPRPRPAGAPAAPLLNRISESGDPSLRVEFTEAACGTAERYVAILTPTAADGTPVEVALTPKPVGGWLVAQVFPNPPDLPVGTYKLEVRRLGGGRLAGAAALLVRTAPQPGPFRRLASPADPCVHQFPSHLYPCPQLAAYNENGDIGARSATSDAFQLGSVAPTAPVAPTAAAPAPVSATVSFQEPASNGGAPVLRCAQGAQREGRRGREEGERCAQGRGRPAHVPAALPPARHPHPTPSGMAHTSPLARRPTPIM